MRLIPRDHKFYDLFQAQTKIIKEAADKLLFLLQNFTDVEKQTSEIKFIEHKGDQLTHELIAKLNRTFITPFDREDIHALASALDDVLDLIDAVGSRLVTYKVKVIRPGAVQLAQLIQHDSEIILRAVSKLNKPDNILEDCDQISQLEKEADRIKSECVARLFEDFTGAVEIIKWKEIFEVLESTTDKCEDVADVLEAVVLKAA